MTEESKAKVTECTITVGRTISLAPYESLRVEITETYKGLKTDEARDKAASKLSRRMVNLVALERTRHKNNLEE